MSKLPILFEDEHFVIVNKPANILSVPDRYLTHLPNLKTILRKQYGEIFVLHRLDFETSGVICFGKTAEIQKQFTDMQISNAVNKHYIAVVQGIPPNTTGEIDVPLEYNMGKTSVSKSKRNGKEAQTYYEAIETFDTMSVLKVRIANGRTHQIRVHMAHIGFPLAIDKVYGYNSEIFLSSFKRKKYHKGTEGIERPLVSRQTLHAAKLEFKHPLTGDHLSIEAELPKDIRALLNQLRKNQKT